MHWLLTRPLLGWAAMIMVHAIAIPLVYGIGKARGMKLAREACMDTERFAEED